MLDDNKQDSLACMPFAHFRQLNAIELKGCHDVLTVKDFNKIMYYTEASFLAILIFLVKQTASTQQCT
ncbi:Uncharacterised protein [Candidatus Venteria ishoeyi]|uniref:Uncharacterized protein n=1 Tax=Candidatus Venteria ishoeyi TaxID=1899563 RepID=A0A1H6F495_9GAMM|nr:Uncharacterised protein [Candidatus Venteria ishoeyi]